MRSVERERRGVWVSNFESKHERLTTDGKHTGEWVVVRSKPFLITPTLSPCGGNTYSDGFGWGTSYDRTMILDRIDIKIEETAVLWVDDEPETDDDGELVLDSDGNPTVPWDYTVKTVAESYNYVNVALSKVQQ